MPSVVRIRCCGPLALLFALAVLAVVAGVLSASARSNRLGLNFVIASGTVVGSDQQPVGGAYVFLYYIPVKAKAYKAPPLATSRTDDAGTFSLEAKDSPTLEKLAAPNGGWFNLDLVVWNGSLSLYRGVPRMFSAQGWIGPDVVNGSVDVGPLLFAPGAPGVGGKGGTTAVADALGRTSGCVEVAKQVKPADLYTTVGELHTVGQTATFTYGPTAHTTVGQPVSTAGGPWSVPSGSWSTASNPRPPAVVWSAPANFHKLVRTKFRYRRLHLISTCAIAPWDIVQVNGWLGGQQTATATDWSKACRARGYTGSTRTITRAAGSPPFTRSSGGSTYTYSKAVNFASLGVVDGSGVAVPIPAYSQWSANVQATWSFPVAGSLCGDNGLPNVSKRIFAGT